MLEKIILKKREDLKEQKKKMSIYKIKKQAFAKNKSSEFLVTLQRQSFSIIAEVKFASPSAGILADHRILQDKIIAYKKAGFDVISVITEEHFFSGKKAFVDIVKQTTHLPVLQKDFVIDQYQIYEAKLLGSDSLLFIARILSSSQLTQFVDIALALGIEPIVEAQSTQDLVKAYKTRTRIIAVNARDLNTFAVDVQKASSLLSQIPIQYLRLGFSGIKSQEEVLLYRNAGANGILVGSSLMKVGDVYGFFSQIKTN